MQTWEDHNSRDPVARKVFLEQLQILKENCWYSYMIFMHWFNDQVFAQEEHKEKKFFIDGKPGTYVDHETDCFVFERVWHKPHKRGVGLSSRYPVYAAEGGAGNNKIGERSPGGDSITVKEVSTFGIVEYGYGKWIRVVEKEGQYGRFISLEAGITVAGKNEDGEVITDTKTEKWFSIPYDSTVIDQIALMLGQAGVALKHIAAEVQPEMKQST